MNRNILIVDDKISTLKVVCAILEDEGYTVFKARDGHEALTLIEQQERIDAVLADLKMPVMDGLTLFRRMKALHLDIPFVIMTAHGTIESAVKAMKEGITNYLIKPLNYEELSIVLERAIREKNLVTELNDLRREIRGKYAFHNIIGTHPSMKSIFEMLATVAPTDAPVLIRGETGTGKELLAKAIHAMSRRSEKPMVCINSAALSDNLLEAELFGHTKGAFTGAITHKKGRLEMAGGGTLFLDEIGHMSLNLQTKLLRFLQEGTFEPVGGTDTRHVDVRVLAATNLDLNAEIKAGRFLSDVLYRIEVITLEIPPLRCRGDDVLLLADHFLKTHAAAYQKKITGMTSQAIERLMGYAWPGNVRELENIIARGVILAKTDQILVSDLPERLQMPLPRPAAPPSSFALPEIPAEGIALKELERELIRKTIDKCQGNKSKAAQLLGVSRKTLYEKLDRYDLNLT